jgi:glucose-6-phosphate isomerase, archaeal
MNNFPFGFELLVEDGKIRPTKYDNHIKRTLADMQDRFADRDACKSILKGGNELLYEVYEIQRPERAGELLHGLSIVHPGRVGDEYFMTKGHFHAVPDTAEVYYCLAGYGLMLMQNPEGEWAAEQFCPGRVVYVPPRWAHRSVNTSEEEALTTLFVYPGNAGHDYGTIEIFGFRKLVIRGGDGPQFVDNPNWVSD